MTRLPSARVGSFSYMKKIYCLYQFVCFLEISVTTLTMSVTFGIDKPCDAFPVSAVIQKFVFLQ